MNTNRLTAFGLLLVVSIIWGVATPVIKHTLSYFSPAVFLTYRFFLSTIVAIGYFSFFPKTLPTTPFAIRHTVVHGISSVILGLGLLFLGLNYTDSLTANLLITTGPVFTILMGITLLKEKVSRHEMVGLGIALLGSILTVFTGDGALSQGLFGAAMIGNALILISALSGSIGSVSAKKALNHHTDPQAITHIGFVLGFIFFSVFTIWQLGGIGPIISTIIHAPRSAHLGVLYMALISGTLGYILSNIALKKIDLGETSIFTYLAVLWGAPVSILWLHEPLTPQFIIGGALIAIGVTVAEWKRRQKKKRK